MEKILATLIEEFQAGLSTFDGSVPRQLALPNIPNKIMVVIGMRRTGKTYFLFQQIKALIAQNVPLSSILYINFEDDRLLAASNKNLVPTTTLQSLLDAFYSLYPENHERKTYLFLDEIQNVANWPIVIRRFFDKKNIQLFLTGSSAKLLSKEISTALRGRSIATEMWPYSFAEYLSARQYKYPSPSEHPFGQQTLDKLKKQFLTYLSMGGFPETTSLTSMDKNRLLREYVDVTIFRDMIERHKITNIAIVKYLIRTLIKNAGCLIAVNKLFNDLKSQGFQVGKATLYNYLSYIEDAYLAFTVPLYSESIRKIQVNPRKVYIIDSAIHYAYTLKPQSDNGHLLENLVYLDLRRKGYEVYYYNTKSGYEVDFFAKGIDGRTLLYQVVWDTSDQKTYEREVRALKEAEQELDIKGQIITVEKYLNNFLSTSVK